jgi:integrase
MTRKKAAPRQEPPLELLGEWMEHWLRHRRRAPNTLAHEWSHYRTHFGVIREIPVAELTTFHCRAWLDDLRFRLQEQKPPQGQPHTVQHCYNLLRSSLNGAVEFGLMDRNPVAAIPRPRIPKPSPKFLMPEEVERVMRLVNRSGDPRAVAVNLMLRLGIRRGEALGLTWGDIDFDDSTISISHQLQRIENPERPGRSWLQRVALKTSASARTLTVDEHLARYLAELRSTRADTTQDDFVVRSRDGGPVDPDGVTSWLRKLGMREGVVCTPHRLRHTAATMMLRHEIALPTVGAVLGHTDVRTTSVYARVMDSSKEEALRTLGTVLGEVKSGRGKRSRVSKRNGRRPSASS